MGRSPIYQTIFETWILESAYTEASVGIGDGEILAGNLPRKQLRLVQEWIELHRDELMADWELADNGEELYKISPL
ncbi:MAG: DUF4160 domain-containing protein [Desulfobulbaceae bacterium]|nr:DUF4160 domain-containing protein [Desulfobulbaceae bacterium]